MRLDAPTAANTLLAILRSLQAVTHEVAPTTDVLLDEAYQAVIDMEREIDEITDMARAVVLLYGDFPLAECDTDDAKDMLSRLIDQAPHRGHHT